MRAVADVPKDVLILGAGPLARLTGETIRREKSHRKILGYLAFQGEEVDPRLCAEARTSLTGAIRTCSDP